MEGRAPISTNGYVASKIEAASRIAVCGLGARGRLLFICGVVQEVSDLWRGRPLNKSSRTQDYFEAQSREKGPGLAFQSSCKASLNTGLEGPIPMDMEGLSLEQQNTLSRMTDMAGHITELLTKPDREKILELLESLNVASAILFERAFCNESLDTSTAFGPRNFVGEVLEIMTNDAIELAAKYLPWLNVNFYFGIRVVDIDLTNHQKPILTVQRQKAGWKETLPAYDLLVKATGTTYEVPVSGKVEKMAFTGVPNPDAIWHYLKERRLFQDDGFLKPHTRVFIGGASLAAFDPVGMLLTWTGIVKLDSSSSTGFSINEKQARQYPRLITFFNRTDGEVVAPRHTNHASIPEHAAIFTPEMILAQQLHKSHDCFQVYLEMVRVLTAVHFKKLPEEIEPRLTTEERLTYMAEENEKLAQDCSVVTEPFLIQGAFWGLFAFFSLGSDPEKKYMQLKEQFPLLTRNGWDAIRSATFTATHEIEGTQESSKRHLAARRTVMHHITASPFPIHTLITRLHQLGVIAWIQGAYDHVSWSGDHFLLQEEKAHALIAAKILTARTDALSASILAQCRKPAPADPIYDKGRFPLSPSGRRVHVMELGLPGHGEFKDSLFVGTQWFDTNSYESAHQLMPIVATTIHLLEDMFSRKLPNPVERLMSRYTRTLPPESEFFREAKALRKPFEECHQILLFAKLVAKVCPSGEGFSEMMKKGLNRGVRKALVEEMRKSGHEGVCDDHEVALSGIQFDPFDRDGFEITSPDFSAAQIEEIKRVYWKERGIVEE